MPALPAAPSAPTLPSASLVHHCQLSRPTVGLQVLLRQFHATNGAELVLRPPGLMLLTPFPGWLACSSAGAADPMRSRPGLLQTALGLKASFLHRHSRQHAQHRPRTRGAGLVWSHMSRVVLSVENRTWDTVQYTAQGWREEFTQAGRIPCYSAIPHFPEAQDEQRLSVDMCATERQEGTSINT